MELPVWNTVQAYKQIQRFTEVKRPRGLRIRYNTDVRKKLVLLEARHYEALRVVKRCLQDGGFLR